MILWGVLLAVNLCLCRTNISYSSAFEFSCCGKKKPKSKAGEQKCSPYTGKIKILKSNAADNTVRTPLAKAIRLQPLALPLPPEPLLLIPGLLPLLQLLSSSRGRS